MALFNIVWISNSRRNILIQINFQYLHEASSVFFMVVLMQYIKQQIKFFTIIDNHININHISVPDCWLNDIMIMHFYYLNPVVLKSVVLKYGNLRLSSLRSMRDQVNW